MKNIAVMMASNSLLKVTSECRCGRIDYLCEITNHAEMAVNLEPICCGVSISSRATQAKSS